MPEKFLIKGQKPLQGTIEVRGAKNAALKVFIASLLTDQEWEIYNVPEIEDISREIEMLKDLGVDVEKLNSGSYKVQAKNIKKVELDPGLTQRIRTSIVLARS